MLILLCGYIYIYYINIQQSVKALARTHASARDCLQQRHALTLCCMFTVCLQQRRALTTPPLPRLHQLARVIVPGNAGRLVTVIALVEQTSIKAQ